MLVKKTAAVEVVPALDRIASNEEAPGLEDDQTDEGGRVRENPGGSDETRCSRLELAKAEGFVRDADVPDTGTDALGSWSGLTLDNTRGVGGATMDEAEGTPLYERVDRRLSNMDNEDVAPKVEGGANDSGRNRGDGNGDIAVVEDGIGDAPLLAINSSDAELRAETGCDSCPEPEPELEPEVEPETDATLDVALFAGIADDSACGMDTGTLCICAGLETGTRDRIVDMTAPAEDCTAKEEVGVKILMADEPPTGKDRTPDEMSDCTDGMATCALEVVALDDAPMGNEAATDCAWVGDDELGVVLL